MLPFTLGRLSLPRVDIPSASVLPAPVFHSVFYDRKLSGCGEGNDLLPPSWSLVEVSCWHSMQSLLLKLPVMVSLAYNPSILEA